MSTSRLHLGLFPLAFTSCCCDIACSWERLPVLQQLGPHQALGVEKNRDLLWLTYARGGGRPWWRCSVQRGRRLGPGTRRAGALQPRCYLPRLSPSQWVCPSPPTGSLLSCQSRGGIRLARPHQQLVCRGPFRSVYESAALEQGPAHGS